MESRTLLATCVLFLLLNSADAQGQDVGESCAADADCYDTNANWCHSETGVCASKSDTGGACTTDSHCKYDRACLGGYCCRFHDLDDDYGGASYCTACTPRTDITKNFLWEAPCTACEEGAWLDVSEVQERIDDYSDSDYDLANVVADFGVCRETCTADEYQSGTGCAAKRAAGESCGGSSDLCASGMCGGNYCCDEAAASAGCSNPCDAGTGACATTAQIGESCAADADCYDTNANCGLDGSGRVEQTPRVVMKN